MNFRLENPSFSSSDEENEDLLVPSNEMISQYNREYSLIVGQVENFLDEVTLPSCRSSKVYRGLWLIIISGSTSTFQHFFRILSAFRPSLRINLHRQPSPTPIPMTPKIKVKTSMKLPSTDSCWGWAIFWKILSNASCNSKSNTLVWRWKRKESLQIFAQEEELPKVTA